MPHWQINRFALIKIYVFVAFSLKKENKSQVRRKEIPRLRDGRTEIKQRNTFWQKADSLLAPFANKTSRVRASHECFALKRTARFIPRSLGWSRNHMSTGSAFAHRQYCLLAVVSSAGPQAIVASVPFASLPVGPPCWTSIRISH